MSWDWLSFTSHKLTRVQLENGESFSDDLMKLSGYDLTESWSTVDKINCIHKYCLYYTFFSIGQNLCEYCKLGLQLTVIPVSELKKELSVYLIMKTVICCSCVSRVTNLRNQNNICSWTSWRSDDKQPEHTNWCYWMGAGIKQKLRPFCGHHSWLAADVRVHLCSLQ